MSNLTKFTSDVLNVSALADRPSVSGAQLKAVFDEAGKDIKTYINTILTEELDTKLSDLDTLINTRVQNKMQDIYHIGKVIIDFTDTNPASYLGFGTWDRIAEGKVLVGYDSNDTDYNASGKTGGNKKITLAVGDLPSHNHSYDKTSSVTGTALSAGQLPSHSHTYIRATGTSNTILTANQIPSHKHSYTKATGVANTTLTEAQMPKHKHTYTKTTGTQSTTLSVNQIPNHAHAIYAYQTSKESGGEYGLEEANGFQKRVLVTANPGNHTSGTGGGQGHNHGINTASDNTGEKGGGQGHNHTLNTSNADTGSVGNSQGHNHGIISENSTTGSIGSGQTHTHTPQYTATNTSSKGNGDQIDIRQPYITVYMFKRVS